MYEAQYIIGHSWTNLDLNNKQHETLKAAKEVVQLYRINAYEKGVSKPCACRVIKIEAVIEWASDAPIEI